MQHILIINEMVIIDETWYEMASAIIGKHIAKMRYV